MYQTLVGIGMIAAGSYIMFKKDQVFPKPYF